MTASTLFSSHFFSALGEVHLGLLFSGPLLARFFSLQIFLVEDLG